MSIKKILILLVFLFFTCTTTAYCKVIKKDIEVQVKDSSIIKATISYVQINGVKKYSTVLLLHSLGYSSEDWGNLINDLNNAGYAVIAMDLRGHGKSVYDGKLKERGWTYFNNKTYQKFPSDVLAILNQIRTQEKNIDLNNFAIVGADIGANTAILASKELKKRPKTLVLISPTISFKGLYVPIAMTDLDSTSILSMVSTKDRYCMEQQRELAKFSQGGFYAQNYPNGGMGMTMIKLNPTMSQDITRWIVKYLK